MYSNQNEKEEQPKNQTQKLKIKNRNNIFNGIRELIDRWKRKQDNTKIK